MALLTEESVQALFDWMTRPESSDDIGAARGAMELTKNRIDIVEARLFLASMESSDAKRKAAARAHPDYERACEAAAKAAERYEKLRQQARQWELVQESWRTLHANERRVTNFR